MVGGDTEYLSERRGLPHATVRERQRRSPPASRERLDFDSHTANHHTIVQNVELKARLLDLDAARRVAASIATQHLGTQHQIDTYFHCRQGRLKLRQINGLSAQLIAYSRPDAEEPKMSDYRLVPVANPETLKAALTAALGVQIVVDKRREIYLVDNVRIHLDEVSGLGQFLEFEAVLGPDVDKTAGQAQLAQLVEQFAINPADRVAGSYADLLTRQSGSGGV